MCAMQYAWNKHLHLREGHLWQPLLEQEEEGRAGQHQHPAAAAPAGVPASYHFLASKLFWAGIALLLLAGGLLALTIYTLLAPPV